MAPSKTDLANEAAAQEAQQLVNLWLQTKAYIAQAFTDTPVGQAEEQAFLQTKSQVSQNTRLVSQKLPPDVRIGGEQMQELLRQAISISHMRSLPKSDKQVMVANWHAGFISLARAAGCLQFIAQGYKPQPKAAKAGSPGSKAVKQKPKADWGGRIKAIVALLVIGGVVWWFFLRK